MDGHDPPGFWRADFVLHLHGFHHDNTLPGYDLISVGDKHANDLAWHRGLQHLPPFEPCRSAHLGSARVLHLDGEARSVYVD